MANDELQIDTADLETSDLDEPTEAVDLEGDKDAPLVLTEEEAEAPNLVPRLEASQEGAKWLKKLAARVMKETDSWWDSSEKWRQDRASNYKVMVGDRSEENTEVRPGGAKMHDPLMLVRILRLYTNLKSELLLDREFIYNVVSTGGQQGDAVARALTIHGHWQLENEITDFRPQQSRGLLEFAVAGDVFAWSSRDEVNGRNCHDILTAEDIVFPYVHVSTRHDMSDVPGKTRILRKHRYEVKRLKGAWEHVDDILKHEPVEDDDKEKPLSAAVQNFTGHRKDEMAKDHEYVFYEWHGFEELPGSEDDRAICAIVDPATGHVARVYVREEVDWRDQARFDEEAQQLAQFTTETEGWEEAGAFRELAAARLTDPMIDPLEAKTLSDGMAALPQQPPTPPAWMKPEQVAAFQRGEPVQPRPPRKVPIESGSHGWCIENPVGALGLAWGHILRDENILSNEALDRFYDAGAIGNASMLLTSDPQAFPNGQIPIGPGRVFHLKGLQTDDIRKAVYELRPAGANPQMMEMSRLANEWADGVTVAGIVSGEPGKSGETFRGVATRMERAVKTLSVPATNYCDFLGQIFKHNARLNYMFMPEKQLIDFRGQTGVEVRREWYRGEYRVSFTADMKFQSQAQKVSEADEVLSMVTNIPPLANNPALLYGATKDALEARGKKHLVDALGPPPPLPTANLAEVMAAMMQPPPGAAPPGAAPPPGAPPPEGGPPPEAMPPPGPGGLPEEQPQ